MVYCKFDIHNFSFTFRHIFLNWLCKFITHILFESRMFDYSFSSNHKPLRVKMCSFFNIELKTSWNSLKGFIFYFIVVSLVSQFSCSHIFVNASPILQPPCMPLWILRNPNFVTQCVLDAPSGSTKIFKSIAVSIVRNKHHSQ